MAYERTVKDLGRKDGNSKQRSKETIVRDGVKTEKLWEHNASFGKKLVSERTTKK